MRNNTNFEFDSRCPDSKYVPAITAEINKLNNSLLQQPNCTWAYLGNGRDGQEANRYLFWTSLDTDKVGPGQKIPVIIQTGDGNYYVSETTTGTRNGKDYVTISKSLTTQNQYKEILNKRRTSILRWKRLTMPTSKHWVIPNTIPYASPSLKMLYSVTTSKSAFSATSSNTKRDSLKVICPHTGCPVWGYISKQTVSFLLD